MQNIKYAIFDVDGTILDSMHAWDDVAERYLQSQGKTPLPGLRGDMRGIGGHELPDYFREHYGIHSTQAGISAAINSLLRGFYHNTAQPKPGVAEVLDALARQGTRMCVATATDRELIEPALERCGLLRYFSRVFTCGEEKTGKHLPDIYIRAARHLGSAPRETYVFEDALYAVATAKDAGFIVTAVYDESSGATWERARSIADFYVKSFETFIAAFA